MLKRSKTDDQIDLEVAGTHRGAVLVLNSDEDACELIARLVESAGWSARRSYVIDGVNDQLEQGEFSSVVIDSMAMGITKAFHVLDEIRGGPSAIRNVPVVILATTDTNRLFAFQSGVDGYVVRPVHADEFLDVMRLVLGRSLQERTDFRRAQLMGGATTA